MLCDEIDNGQGNGGFGGRKKIPIFKLGWILTVMLILGNLDNGQGDDHDHTHTLPVIETTTEGVTPGNAGGSGGGFGGGGGNGRGRGNRFPRPSRRNPNRGNPNRGGFNG